MPTFQLPQSMDCVVYTDCGAKYTPLSMCNGHSKFVVAVVGIT